jgi:hypothetical protein
MRPFLDILAYASAYIAGIGAVTAANAVLLRGRESPWSWYWLLWAVYCLPLFLFAIAFRLRSAFDGKKLLTFYATALAFTVTVAEVGYVGDLGPWLFLLVMFVAALLIAWTCGRLLKSG